jgi:phage portal protein BeeE
VGLLERVTGERDGRRGLKQFEEPPIWALDRLRDMVGSGLMADREQIENHFEGYVWGAYKRSGPVFACMLARQMVFSEARLMFQRLRSGRPGDLFSTADLALLETPWPGATTGELLVRMIQDADLAGNAYYTTADNAGRMGKAARGPGRRVVRMRPDWVTLIIDSASGDPWALDARVVGLLYQRGSTFATAGVPSADAVLLLPDEVAHFAPIPDPVARFRGMSWLTPVLREIASDSAATAHKDRLFTNAALPSMLVKFDRETSPEKFDQFVARFNASHRGVENAYKTLFLGGGADATPLTFNFQELEFSQVQGKGEARIAAAAGVPPSWVGFSEGLQGSALNAGNFNSARRRFADGTIRPLWRMAAGALQVLVPPPAASRLWYDARDVAFLREDRKDAAEIAFRQAQTIRTLVDSGFTADSVKAAVEAEDWTLLEHTGLFSVQLQPPGTRLTPNAPAALPRGRSTPDDDPESEDV